MTRFTGELWTVPGPGGWTFVDVPESCAPPVLAGWGRTPVVATVDGTSWNTSVWRDRTGRTSLPVPKRIRRGKVAGDVVEVELQPRS